MDFLKQIDQSLLLFLNGFHNSYWDKAITIFTSIEIWIPLYLLIIYVVIKTYKRNAIYILIFIALAIVLSDQFSGLIKNSVQRLRPTHDPALSDLVHNVYNRGGLYSYFSAHAANTFTIAILTTRLFKRNLYTILIFLWAIMVSYTRIYLGLHYPGDVLTGWVWGIFTGLVFYRLMVIAQRKYFKAISPEISSTTISSENLLYLAMFLLIYIGTILLTINRLTKFQFFGS